MHLINIMERLAPAHLVVFGHYADDGFIRPAEFQLRNQPRRPISELPKDISDDLVRKGLLSNYHGETVMSAADGVTYRVHPRRDEVRIVIG